MNEKITFAEVPRVSRLDQSTGVRGTAIGNGLVSGRHSSSLRRTAPVSVVKRRPSSGRGWMPILQRRNPFIKHDAPGRRPMVVYVIKKIAIFLGPSGLQKSPLRGQSHGAGNRSVLAVGGEVRGPTNRQAHRARKRNSEPKKTKKKK